MTNCNPDLEYLDRRLEILLLKSYPNLLNELSNAGTSFNEFKGWTPLKLVALPYFVQPYLNIIRSSLENKGMPTTLIYIDLFSGSGINKVEKYSLAGSPIITIDCATKAKRQFNYLFFVDNNGEHARSLEERLKFLESVEIHEQGKLFPEKKFSWISGKYEVLSKDANIAIDKIIAFLNRLRYKNYLAFLDPYKWQLEWKTLEKLLKIQYGDLFITLQATLIAKEVGRAESLSEDIKKELSKFFGESEEVWIELNREGKVKEFYINKIKNYRKYIKDIMIQGRTSKGTKFKYYLIFATRKENPPWKAAIERLKKVIESYSGDIVEHAIKRLYGDAVRITDFLED